MQLNEMESKYIFIINLNIYIVWIPTNVFPGHFYLCNTMYVQYCHLFRYSVMYKSPVPMPIHSWFCLSTAVDVTRTGNPVSISWERSKLGSVTKISDLRPIIRFPKLSKHAVLEYVWLTWTLLISFDETEAVSYGNIANPSVETATIRPE